MYMHAVAYSEWTYYITGIISKMLLLLLAHSRQNDYCEETEKETKRMFWCRNILILDFFVKCYHIIIILKKRGKILLVKEDWALWLFDSRRMRSAEIFETEKWPKFPFIFWVVCVIFVLFTGDFFFHYALISSIK